MSTTIVRSAVKTGRTRGNVIVQDYYNPVYAATLSLTTLVEDTLFQPGQLTGAVTINAVTTNALIGDKLTCLFAADGTNRVVTFGTNMASSGTLTITASKFGSAQFVFDGTNWVQVSTTATA